MECNSCNLQRLQFYCKLQRLHFTGERQMASSIDKGAYPDLFFQERGE